MEQLLTTPEVAKLLNVTPQSVRRWQMRNAIPYFKVNGAVRFSPAALETWLANCSMGPESPPLH